MARLHTTLTAVILALALLPMGAAATPADTTTTPEETLTKTQLFRLLNSDALEKQTRALRLISHYAHTGQHDEDFYRLMVTPLKYLVAKGQTESLRIMAVSALYSIGTDDAMRELQAQADTLNAPRVAEVAKNALLEYERTRTAVQR